jgi:hypothetical protein
MIAVLVVNTFRRFQPLLNLRKLGLRLSIKKSCARVQGTLDEHVNVPLKLVVFGLEGIVVKEHGMRIHVTEVRSESGQRSFDESPTGDYRSLRGRAAASGALKYSPS